MKKHLKANNSEISEEQSQVLIDFLKIRTESLVNYSNRVWKIFNWFVTINLGFFVFIFNNQIKITHPQIFYFIGILINCLWLLIGVNDYLSMLKHKTIKEQIEKKLLSRFDLGKLIHFKNPSNCFIHKLKFNQTKTLYVVPMICLILGVIGIIINYKF